MTYSLSAGHWHSNHTHQNLLKLSHIETEQCYCEMYPLEGVSLHIVNIKIPLYDSTSSIKCISLCVKSPSSVRWMLHCIKSPSSVKWITHYRNVPSSVKWILYSITTLSNVKWIFSSKVILLVSHGYHIMQPIRVKWASLQKVSSQSNVPCLLSQMLNTLINVMLYYILLHYIMLYYFTSHHIIAKYDKIYIV